LEPRKPLAHDTNVPDRDTRLNCGTGLSGLSAA
jgi:hypothetical protein